MLPRLTDRAALTLMGATLAIAFTAALGITRDSTSPCTERVFLSDNDSYSWGTITRWGSGYLTAFHVIDSGQIVDGPAVSSIGDLPATDFSFLTGAAIKSDPATIPAPQGAVTLEGFPARATMRERLNGTVYAPDTVPPGIWVMLDHPEPLVGGFSGGCVRDADNEVVAVIMGASSMKLDGQTRHFARVIPIRDALHEIQGTPPPNTRPLTLLPRLIPALQQWPERG